MDYEMIEKKIKDFCEEMYSDACRVETGQDVYNLRAIAYGALRFACNNLFPAFNEELAEWWDEYMWMQFEELIRKIRYN